MNEEQKPKVAAMLALYRTDPDAYWREVSRAISPKPWLHNCIEGRDSEYRCRKCGMSTEQGLWPQGQSICTVPPNLMQSPAEIAEELRGKAFLLDLVSAIKRVYDIKYPHSTTNPPDGIKVRWFGLEAKPHERIACCIVAMGHWEV